MLLRTFALLLVVAVVLVVAPTLVAEEKEKPKTAMGTVVKADAKAGTLTVKGKDGKEHTCKVGKDTKITCDGKACKLEDLKADTKVKVTLAAGTATKIEASTK